MAQATSKPYDRHMAHPQPPDRASIGRALRAARDAKGWSQADLSFQLRLHGGPRDSLGSIARWESIGSIKLDDAILLASIYEMSLDDLLNAGNNGRDDPSPDLAELADETSAKDTERGKRRQRRAQKPPSSDE